MPPPRPDQPTGSSSAAAGAARKEDNIYIPSFISKQPFYVTGQDENDSLQHQRSRLTENDDEKAAWHDRGKQTGPARTKWVKGACENCGAMGHQKRDCLERPRKVGAKFSGKDIKADRFVKEMKLGYDAKRDRYSGYDPREYKAVVDEYNQMEELRKQLQARKAAETGEEIQDGDKYAEESDMSKHQPTSTRQLRIREDTAKYLLNLGLDSAKYDPKTRSMVDGGATADKAAALFAEEGTLKSSGDAGEFERAQRYAWETQEKTGDTSQHLQANPTAGELSRKKENEVAEQKRLERARMLAEKYGNQQDTMPTKPGNLTMAESEHFVEYDEAGLIKGAPRKTARSKYPEDVLVNNHNAVWGSWWTDFQWGYACCHSLIKNSYCTGEEGKRAWEQSQRHKMGADLVERGPAEDEQAEFAHSTEEAASSQKRSREEMMAGVTEAELDEYRRKRTAANDPMARLLGKDELVH
ncbi:pre-mRNA-splicing factor SLU7 [Thozetella sp. PMI_491]|nr:pre-mRNA-splicing factor SLU7 [Thozetella sp. PMI_491]